MVHYKFTLWIKVSIGKNTFVFIDSDFTLADVSVSSLKPPPLQRYYDLFTNKEKVVETSETRKGPGRPRNQPVVENTQPVGSEAVPPEILVTSPRKVFIFIMKKKLYRIKVSKRKIDLILKKASLHVGGLEPSASSRHSMHVDLAEASLATDLGLDEDALPGDEQEQQ